jgi:hypothetical protein
MSNWTKKETEKQIEKNRDEINNLLSQDFPLDLVYWNIRRLAAQNERLLSELNSK